MKEITTEVNIDATASRVWQILTDLQHFPEWNPFVREAMGTCAVGQRLTVRIEPPGGKPMTFKPTVTKLVAEREFRWLGRLGLPGVFDGEHIFEITALDQNRTRLVQREEFRGVLVTLLWNSMADNTRRGFELMNKALKERAESGNPNTAP